MEYNHCVMKDIILSNQLIAKVPLTRNCLFPLRIRPMMKERTNRSIPYGNNENSRAAFKAKRKDEEKNIVDIQPTFRLEGQDESWLWNFIFGHLNFHGLNLFHMKNIVK